MKRILISMLTLLSLSVSAQRLVITKSVVDCGNTEYMRPVTATFELWNKSTKKMTIHSVKTDCGCTKVDYPKGSIAGGEHFQVKVTYDARQLGHFHKMAAIMSNASEKPVFLTMTGVVLAEMEGSFDAYPYEIGELRLDKRDLEFDDVNKGDMPVQEVHILNNGKKVLSPNVMHLPSYLSADLTPARLAPGRSGKIVFTLNSSNLRDYGLTQSSVYLAKEPGEKVSPSNEMGVSVVLLPALSGGDVSNVPRLALSSENIEIAFAGKSKKKNEIILSNQGSAPLEISSLQMFTSGLEVTLNQRSLAPGESTKLKVTAYREQLSKVRTRPRILMITNDPNRPKVILYIQIK